LPSFSITASSDPVEWEWRFYHHAYSIRSLLSKYRRWPAPGPTVSDAMLRAVNGELLRAFVRLARENGARPIVVYFPSTVDRDPDATRSLGSRERFFQRITLVSRHDRMREPRGSRRTVRHPALFAATNLAVARCLRDAIGETGAE